MDSLAQSLLRELFNYSPEKGELTWRVSRSNVVKVGDIAGSIDVQSGYRRVGIGNKVYHAHRLIWIYMTGDAPVEVDHIDHNRSNNRWGNLREVDRKTNSRNVSIRKDNRSGFHGVSFLKNKGKWRARITVDGEVVHLGAAYNTKEEAVEARKKAEKKYGIFHKNHGKEIV